MKKTRWIGILLLLVLVGAVMYYAVERPEATGLDEPTEPETSVTEQSPQEELTPTEPADTEEPPVEEVPPAEEPVEEPAEATPIPPEERPWNLILVNPWNALPEDFTVELKDAPNGMQVDARAYDALMAMLNDCRAAGLDPFICSGHRTMQVQRWLYYNKLERLRNAGFGSEEAIVKEAGRWVAVPGTSEHQVGLALDIVSNSNRILEKEQENTPEQKWLMEHCWDYGFILRYAEEKEEITGIGYEPWHYRYVGIEHSLAMRDSGQCLEEYLGDAAGPDSVRVTYSFD